MTTGEPFPRAWLAGDALDAAHRLIGAHLVHGAVTLRIVEVEAYRGPWDTASHVRMGRTARNAPMWGPPGHAYVYLCYGIHHMLNVTARADGEAGGCLVRGAEVVAGADLVAARRGRPVCAGVLAGPGKVAQALGVDTSFSHHDLLAGDGPTLRQGRPPDELAVGPRVGIDYAEPEHRDAPWRVADPTSRQVTHPKALGPPSR